MMDFDLDDLGAGDDLSAVKQELTSITGRVDGIRQEVEAIKSKLDEQQRDAGSLRRQLRLYALAQTVLLALIVAGIFLS